VCWVGEHGVRLYASGLGPSRGSHFLQRQAYLVSRRDERLAVARRMYGMRFPGEDVSKSTMQQLRGREGTRVRRLYREHSKRTGVPWDKREYRAGRPFEAGDDVNRLLSMVNSCLYGICHAAIVGVGASPGLGFVHTGSALSFVHDVADLYKAEFTIPLAFDLAAAGRTEEGDARRAFRDKLVDGKLLARIVNDVRDLLRSPTSETEEATAERNELWDERVGVVVGGRNWSANDEDQDPSTDDEEWSEEAERAVWAGWADSDSEDEWGDLDRLATGPAPEVAEGHLVISPRDDDEPVA